MQCGFYRYVLLADLIWFVVETDLPRTQEKLERDCSENHCERSLHFCDWSSTSVSLFLLTGEAEIVNDQGRTVLCIGISVD